MDALKRVVARLFAAFGHRGERPPIAESAVQQDHRLAGPTLVHRQDDIGEIDRSILHGRLLMVSSCR